jgi:Multicopper oxidase
MRRLGLLLAAVPLALAALAGAPAAARAPVTAVGVSEREFSLSLYRRWVPAGTVRFNVTNYGEDVHNLVARGPGGVRLPATADIGSGGRLSVSWRLRRPGRWVLLCTKAGHARLGMRAVLVVRKR